MNRKISLLLLFLLLISSIPITVRADDPSSFELIPNVDSFTVGQQFNISVFVSPNSTINDAAIDNLTFDPSLVQIVAHNGTDNVSKGNIFNGGTTLLWHSGEIDNTNGKITDIAWVVTPAQSNEGYLCNITFEAIGVGTAYINITEATIAYDIYTYEHQIISNATITITSGLLNEDITTESATGVEETNATLCGQLSNTFESTIQYWFEFGKTTAYGNQTVIRTTNESELNFTQDTAASEFYNFGEDSEEWICDGDYMAQTFTMCETLSVSTLRVKVRRYGLSGPLDAYLTTTNEFGYPSFWLRDAYPIPQSSLPTSSAWINLTLTSSVTLTVDTTYALVLSATTGTGGEVWWSCDSTSPEYDGGSAFVGEDFGYNWYKWSTMDLLFSIQNNVSLLPGTLYHYKAFMNDSVDEYSNNDVTFLTKPEAPTSFDASVFNSTMINLTWVKGEGANKTVVVYDTNNYPSDPTDGSVIYNGTGTMYNHTVTANTSNYYRAWSYTTWASLSQMSDEYDEEYVLSTDYSNVIRVNDTTSVEEISATIRGFVGNHNSSNVRVGFAFGTSDGEEITDFDSNITYGTGISENTAFSVSASGLDVAEYYYVRTWMRILNDEEYEWYLSSSVDYFLTKPYNPQNLTIEASGGTGFEVSWDETEEFGSGTTIQTVVRYKKESYPTSPLGGDGSVLAYNGTDENCSIFGLDDDSIYYIRIWTCAHCAGSPHLYQYSDSYDSGSGSTFSGLYNISVRYENRTYGPVNLSRGHYHRFIIHYSGTTEINEFNNTGAMNGGNDTEGNWDHVNEGWFTINLSQRPLFFEFYWNASSTYLNGSGNETTSFYSCHRVLVPNEGQSNVTFFIRDNLPVYYDSSVTRNGSLVRYSMSFLDTSGEFVPANNPYAIIFTYDDNNTKMVIHSEYFDSSRIIFPMLVYDKRYYIGVSCDSLSFERISTYIAGDDQNPKITIPYQYTELFTFYDLMEVDIGWYDSGFFLEYQETTGYIQSVTFYVWGYDNDTLMYTDTKYISVYNFTYPCNTSKAWKYNLKVVIDDTDPDDNINHSGTYWLAASSGATIIFPGIDHIITINDINDIFEIMFGDSPMQNEKTGASVEWTYIALFGFSFILLVTFGKLNAFVGGLAVGLFLVISGGYIFGLMSTILAIGVFIIGISIVGLLGGVDTR